MGKKNILIYGSTGWLGRMTISYLRKHEDCKLTLIASRKKEFEVDGSIFETISPSEFLQIKEESFDHYFNFAFLTQEKIKILGREAYEKITNSIIDREKTFFKNNTINNAFLSSSGAVYWKDTPKNNLYTSQKLEQEKRFIENSLFSSTNYLVGRIFGIIGNNYDFSKSYAFTDFIHSGVNSQPIIINSSKRVVRSYLYFENLLKFIIYSGKKNMTFDAWDRNYDLIELAEIIGNIFNVEVIVKPEYLKSTVWDEYTSKRGSFDDHASFSISQEDVRLAIFDGNTPS